MPTQDNRSISVILPCYNEEKNIRHNVFVIFEYLLPNFNTFEIIAVNDGSSDNTLSELKRAKKEKPDIPLRIISKKQNSGKGEAVKIGVLKSHYSIITFLDADLAIPIYELKKFVVALKEGSDIAIASRFIAKIQILKPILWYRSFMEKVFRILRMLIINNYEIQDTQCGFKVFTRRAALKIFPQLTVKRFSFDVEVIFLAKKMGFKIKELPITLQNPQKSHIRIVSDSINMFFDLFRIRWNDFSGKYDAKTTQHKNF